MTSIELQQVPEADATVFAHDLEDKHGGFIEETYVEDNYDPTHDKRDMYRMGRRDQLRRRFKYCESSRFRMKSSVLSLSNNMQSPSLASSLYWEIPGSSQ